MQANSRRNTVAKKEPLSPAQVRAQRKDLKTLLKQQADALKPYTVAVSAAQKDLAAAKKAADKAVAAATKAHAVAEAKAAKAAAAAAKGTEKLNAKLAALDAALA